MTDKEEKIKKEETADSIKEEKVEEQDDQTAAENQTDSKEKEDTDQTGNEKTQDHSKKNVLEEFGEQIGKFATNTIDTLKKGVDKALVSRNTVLTIRVTDEANRKLSMLVEAGLFKSRSESASFLIEEGIKQQEDLFRRIGSKMEEIERLRADLKNIVSEEFKKPEDEQ